jgi:hypothetical protein
MNGTAFVLASASIAVLVVAGLAALWSHVANVLNGLAP